MNLPNDPSDPVLKAAIAEIIAVLEKYDIAGITILQSKTHGEWLNHITASWACTKMEMDGTHEALRIQAKLSDYPSREAWVEAIRKTVSMIFGMRDGAKRIEDNMNGLIDALGGDMDIEHISKFDR